MSDHTPVRSERARMRSLVWTLLAALAMLFVGGCHKASGASSHPSSPGYYEEQNAYAESEAYGGDGGGGGGGDVMYEFADDTLDGEYYAPETTAISSRGRAKKSAVFKTSRDFAPEAEPAPQPAEEPPAPPPIDVAVDSGGQSQPKPAPKQASKKRQVIYTATMQTSVYDLEAAIATAESLPDRYGGWLHQRQDNLVILRVPAEHLEEAMDAIAELGVVEYRLLQAEDVTAEYTDLESRIAVLEEMQAQLKLLLAKANSVEQALQIRKALDAVTLELEVARGRMRELSKSIAFSTLILWFNQRGPATPLPSSNDPFPWVDDLGVEATEYR